MRLPIGYQFAVRATVARGRFMCRFQRLPVCSERDSLARRHHQNSRKRCGDAEL